MILITDTQYLTNQALGSLLASCGHTVRVVEDLAGFQEQIRQEDVELVVADPQCAGFLGITELAALRKASPELRILVLTAAISQVQVKDLHKAGIGNVSLKTDDREELLQAVDAAIRGRQHYSGGVLDILLKKSDAIDLSGPLTRSEIDIVRLIASGLTTKEIARKKQISFHTVMTHRKNIFRKLGISSSSELVLYAIKNGLIETIEYHI